MHTYDDAYARPYLPRPRVRVFLFDAEVRRLPGPVSYRGARPLRRADDFGFQRDSAQALIATMPTVCGVVLEIPTHPDSRYTVRGPEGEAHARLCAAKCLAESVVRAAAGCRSAYWPSRQRPHSRSRRDGDRY